ncbi:MAG: DegT/DnrJ/EryC1/StrS family aminotransferase [candidate division WOR-3 bacterium]
MFIPLYDLRDENLGFLPDFHAALERVVKSDRFVLGEELTKFEKELGGYLGVDEVIGLKSGTDALYFALKGLGIGKGDEVITTPFTFPATVEAILRVGARPVLADIEPETLCLSPERCEAAITKRTKAIILVHLFGNCAEIDRFITICQAHNLFLIEDAAQAIGAEYRGRKLGGFGTCAIFSFYPTKNLGALGNGGALVGQTLDIDCPNSSRLDELQAAFLRIKLTHLDEWLKSRERLARRYESELSPFVKIVKSAPQAQPNYHQFAILTPSRDRLRQLLLKDGVETMLYYPEPIHRQQRFAGEFPGSHLPEAERASAEVLCLPIRQNLTDAEQEVIINSIVKFFKSG